MPKEPKRFGETWGARRVIVYLDANNIKPLDALHLATAIENACGRFLTNDVPLQTFPLITVEILT